MISIKEALTFDDVTLTPKYSEVLPSEVNTSPFEFCSGSHISSNDTQQAHFKVL